MDQHLYNGLPVYQLEIAEDGDSGVSAIAFVDQPAIKRNFLKFKDAPLIQQAFTAYSERRIVSGPLIIPDTLMYRDDNFGKYYAVFTREAVEKVMLKFFVAGNLNSVNLMHQTEDPVENIVLFESFLSDTARGIMPIKGYEDCPEGTWFVSFKVLNDDVWTKVNEETFKGFSIEGLFGMLPKSQDADTIDEDTTIAARELHQTIEGILKKLP